MFFTTISSIFLFFLFLILGIIHFYWASGGQWGIEQALPKNKDGVRMLNPRKIDSVVVGFGLCIFGVFYLLQTTWITINLSNWLLQSASWMIPAIFLLRAIGDFRYAGFFKKIRNTSFAKWDNQLFSPLCLFIGILGTIIALVN